MDRPFSIGTANETSLHAAMKNRIDPDPAHQEVRVGGHIADVFNENGVFEIQTRGFYRLRSKVEQLLAFAPVTVVYPAAAEKRIWWIDPETGERTGGRKGSRPATRYTLWRELPSLGELFGTPDFAVRMLLLEIDEYRLRDGYGPDRKRRATHVDRILRDVRDDFTVCVPGDLAALIPEGLEEPFGSKDFARAARIPLGDAQRALAMLARLGLAAREPGKGRAYAYRLADAARDAPGSPADAAL